MDGTCGRYRRPRPSRQIAETNAVNQSVRTDGRGSAVYATHGDVQRDKKVPGESLDTWSVGESADVLRTGNANEPSRGGEPQSTTGQNAREAP